MADVRMYEHVNAAQILLGRCVIDITGQQTNRGSQIANTDITMSFSQLPGAHQSALQGPSMHFGL